MDSRGNTFVPMVRIVAILMLVLLVQSQLSNSIIYGMYELNRTGYIEKYCENKDKPELKCEGKCHLSKQLSTSSHKSSTVILVLNHLPAIVEFCDLSVSAFNPFLLKKLPIELKSESIFCTGFFTDVFHPPQSA